MKNKPKGHRMKKFDKGKKAIPRSMKQGVMKKVAKKAGKSLLKKAIPPIGAVLTAVEIAKGAVKVGKTIKAKSACNKKGGVYKKGFCITGVKKK